VTSQKPQLPLLYRVLDWLTNLDEALLQNIRYTSYFVGFVIESALSYELIHKGKGTVALMLAVATALVLVSAVLFVPWWSPHVLRRLIRDMESDTKLALASAHARSAVGAVGTLLEQWLRPRTAARLADHLCKLSEAKVYELLRM
jgi:hypothetical protein